MPFGIASLLARCTTRNAGSSTGEQAQRWVNSNTHHRTFLAFYITSFVFCGGLDVLLKSKLLKLSLLKHSPLLSFSDRSAGFSNLLQREQTEEALPAKHQTGHW